MKKLNYPHKLEEFVWSNFSNITDLNKAINSEAFKLIGKMNIGYTILVTTDAYGIGIDNLDNKPVIPSDWEPSFESIIQ